MRLSEAALRGSAHVASRRGGRLVGMRLVLPLAVLVLAVSCGWAVAYLGVSLSSDSTAGRRGWTRSARWFAGAGPLTVGCQYYYRSGCGGEMDTSFTGCVGVATPGISYTP